MTGLTDGSGIVTKTYAYDAFGNEISPGETDTNPFRYCGEYFDNETGSIYLRARYYEPETGRFMTEDPHWNIQNMIYGDEAVINLKIIDGNYNALNDTKNPDYKSNRSQVQISKSNQSIFSSNEQPIVLAGNIVPDIDSIFQSVNLYNYCLQNPLRYFDSSGEFVFVVALAPAIPAWIGYAGAGLLVAGVGAKAGSYLAEHTKLNGSKKRTNDKHTKPRPGRQSEKKKQHDNWKSNSNKRR